MTGKDEYFYSIILRRQVSQRNDYNSGNWVTGFFQMTVNRQVKKSKQEYFLCERSKRIAFCKEWYVKNISG